MVKHKIRMAYHDPFGIKKVWSGCIETSRPHTLSFMFLFVFRPTLDVNIAEFQRAECIDKCACQPAVGYQWHIEIDGCTANLIAVSELTRCEVFGNIYNHVYLLLMEQCKCLRLFALFRRPIDTDITHTIIVQIF